MNEDITARKRTAREKKDISTLQNKIANERRSSPFFGYVEEVVTDYLSLKAKNTLDLANIFLKARDTVGVRIVKWYIRQCKKSNDYSALLSIADYLVTKDEKK